MKRIVYFLTLTLFFCFFSSNAFASLNDIIASGSCGTNVRWNLSQNGILTITGSGDMKDYTPAGNNGVTLNYENGQVVIPRDVYSSHATPWFAQGEKITSVIIEEGVTSIGNFAFLCCSNLTNLQTPDSLTKIGEMAFFGCTSLQVITIPNNVQNLGQQVFYGCPSIQSISVSSNNRYYASEAGVLYNKDKTALITCPEGKRTVSISNTVTDIWNFAFVDCLYLEEISLPTSIERIDDYNFCYCPNLSSVTVPTSNQTYSSHDGALYSKDGKKLFFCPNNAENFSVLENVTSIEKRAFQSCSNLVSIYIPVSVKNIGFMAFTGCDHLSEILYSGTETQWKMISRENGNDVLDKISLVTLSNNNSYKPNQSALEAKKTAVPSSKTSSNSKVTANGKCGDRVIWSLTQDGTLIISGTGKMNNYTTNGAAPLPWRNYKNSIKKVIIKTGVTSIGSNAFNSYDKITSVTIPEGITRIGEAAFYNCQSLSEVSIPTSVASIEVSAFGCCTNLKKIECAFSNKYYSSSDGVLFNKKKTKLICCPGGKSGNYSVPYGVQNIDINAFCYCYSLKEVTLPDTVTKLSFGAFQCSSITTITLPNSLQTVEDAIFYGCESLRRIYYLGTKKQWNAISMNDATRESMSNVQFR